MDFLDQDDYGQFCDLDNYTYQYDNYIPHPHRPLPARIQRHQMYFMPNNYMYREYNHLTNQSYLSDSDLSIIDTSITFHQRNSILCIPTTKPVVNIIKNMLSVFTVSYYTNWYTKIYTGIRNYHRKP
jgi:hypothetical protein